MYWTQGLHRFLQQHPDAAATVFRQRQRTVREHADRVARLASGLRSLGLRDGEPVGVLALNSDRYAELLLAVAWAGGVLTPFSPRWGHAETTYALADSGVRLLCVDENFAAPVKQRPVLYLGDGPAPDGTRSLEAVIAENTPVEDARRGGSAPAALMYTGGTTGEPKGVMLSHDALCGAALTTEATLPSGRPGSRALIATPMSHLSGLITCLIQTTFGGTQVILPAFEPGQVLATIERNDVTHTFLIPSMLRQLLDHPGVADHDLSSLRYLLYGGAPMTESLLARASKALPQTAFQQVYASTEMTVGTFLSDTDHADADRARSAGRAAYNVELRVEDPQGHTVPAGTVGEVVVRSEPMLGYRNKPAETAAVLRDGWLHTGDAGYLDQDGYLYLVDRIKDMIITEGGNVYSAEVENALAGHPAIAACAVIGVPDEKLGERVHAVIVLHPGAMTDVDDLDHHCRNLIAPYKRPRSCEFVPELPLSGVGKPLKHQLRARYWSGMDRHIQ
ncbi:class I adenylate-forming enzyme family protein [Actinoplanes sp. NPDC051513]|uniref:class I adenylate-forming enzyme family protein n=1 Tax=Actinoplanes sp. NPDC051513 TaxID=3363908 RepID=UPI00378A1924